MSRPERAEGSYLVTVTQGSRPGLVERPLQDRRPAPYGLIVDIGFFSFVPRSLVALDQRGDLDALVGQWMKGFVFEVDEKRRNVIVAPTYFGAYDPPPESKTITISDEYLRVLLDNLRGEVSVEDYDRYLGCESARNILVALAGEDCGDDADKW